MPVASTSLALETARLLALRLERLSADSIWAHRASGLRGSLLRMLELAAQNPSLDEKTLAQLENLSRQGFWMLENAAREIPDPARP